MPNEPGTTIFKLQKKFQNVFGFTLPLFHGRGLLNCTCFLFLFLLFLLDHKTVSLTLAFLLDNLGLMPYRRRIVVVIGKPIHTVKCAQPKIDQVMEMQKQYIAELERIWHTYKDEFAKQRTSELRLIE
jgi:hypothetical protein